MLNYIVLCSIKRALREQSIGGTIITAKQNKAEECECDGNKKEGECEKKYTHKHT